MVSPVSDSGPVYPFPLAASRAVPFVMSSANRYVHSLSSLPERGPLISSRTRAKTTAASGGTVANPICFGRQPRATIVPRASPARRSNRSRQTAKIARVAAGLPRSSATFTSATSSTAPASLVPSTPSAHLSSPVSRSLQVSPGVSLLATPPSTASSEAAATSAVEAYSGTAFSVGSPDPTYNPADLDTSHLWDCVQSFNTVDWAREQQQESERVAALRFLWCGTPSPPPLDLLLVSAPLRPPKLENVLALAAKTGLHTTDDNVTLLVHQSSPSPVGRSGGRTTRLPDTGVPRVYVPMLMRPWVSSS